jgi:hypothetical protein
MPAGAPVHLKAAHHAVNKIEAEDDGAAKPVSWSHYVTAQGGIYCGRGYAIRITLQDQEGTGRYGEPLAPKPIGVETQTLETYTPAHMAWMGGTATRVIEWFVESARHVWPITRAAGKFLAERAQPVTPWTCVNNCTPPGVKKSSRNSSGRPMAGGFPGDYHLKAKK